MKLKIKDMSKKEIEIELSQIYTPEFKKIKSRVTSLLGELKARGEIKEMKRNYENYR